jgi:hypothetical protein
LKESFIILPRALRPVGKAASSLYVPVQKENLFERRSYNRRAICPKKGSKKSAYVAFGSLADMLGCFKKASGIDVR